ncbi:MAG: HdeD family acid-resistance protein [Christensenellales bacterium]
MTEFLKKFTGNRIITSTIFIICGLLCLIIPSKILPIVSLLFGIVLFLYGLYQLTTILSVQNSRYLGFSIVACAFSFIFGLILILNQNAGTLMVGLITGVWALVSGLVHLSQVFMLSKMNMNYTEMLVKCIIELLVAILMLVNMSTMVTLQIILLGVILLAYGIYSLVMFFYLFKVCKELETAHQDEMANKDSSTIEIIVEDDKDSKN